MSDISGRFEKFVNEVLLDPEKSFILEGKHLGRGGNVIRIPDGYSVDEINNMWIGFIAGWTYKPRDRD